MTDVTLSSLGAQGDGITHIEGEAVFVPFTLAGEHVSIDGQRPRAGLVSIRAPSPDRISPICKHFGQCGACQLQHMAKGPYHEWKQSLLTTALERMGLDAKTEPLIHFENAARRRATFTLQNSGDGLVMGFAEKASHDFVDISECPVLVDQIASRLSEIKQLGARALMGKTSLRVELLSSDTGLDINFSCDHAINDQVRKTLVAQAVSNGIQRLSVNGEVLVERQKPFITLPGNKGSYQLVPPPGGFLQAVEAAQNTMISLVTKHLKSCKQVADLFCGSGTFSLPLAERSLVHGYEADGPALSALEASWRATAGKLKAISTTKRDLFRSPVTFQELKKMDGVVIDPPRAGAEAQCHQLVKAQGVKRIAAVSCNPVTLARDLKILVDGGYSLRSVTPIDQFTYTPHLEVVALVER